MKPNSVYLYKGQTVERDNLSMEVVPGTTHIDCASIRLFPGQTHKFTSTDAIVYVISGMCGLTVGDDSYTINSGEFTHIPAGKRAEFTNTNGYETFFMIVGAKQ